VASIANPTEVESNIWP